MLLNLNSLHLIIFYANRVHNLCQSDKIANVRKHIYRRALTPSRSEPCPIHDIEGTTAEICVVS